MRGVARQKVGWQGRRPAYSDVVYCGMERLLSLLLSLPVGMRITRNGVSANFVGAVGVSPGGGESRKKGVPTGSARSRSDGIGTVGTDEAEGAGVAVVGGPDRGR